MFLLCALWLQAIRATLGCDELQQLLADVEGILDDDAQVGNLTASTTACGYFTASELLRAASAKARGAVSPFLLRLFRSCPFCGFRI